MRHISANIITITGRATTTNTTMMMLFKMIMMMSTMPTWLVSLLLLSIGELDRPGAVNSNRQTTFHVAPMQGYTNTPVRQLLRALSSSSSSPSSSVSIKLWTEMEKVVDLMDTDERGLDKRFLVHTNHDRFSNDNNDSGSYVLQLGGNDPDMIRHCLQDRILSRPYPISEVNLNCGCPSIETGGANTYGASLMKQPDLVQRLVAAVRETVPDSVRVSVKCRIGICETVEDLLPSSLPVDHDNDYSRGLYRFIESCMDGGIDHVVLHARPAVLAGLNPTKNRIVPELQYDVVHQVVQDFGSKVDVTLNGGIQNLDMFHDLIKTEAIKKKKKKKNDNNGASLDSFMAGRWILRRPLDLVFIGQTVNMDCSDSTSRTATAIGTSPCDDIMVEALRNYGSFIEQSLRTKNKPLHTIAELCLPLYLVLEQVREDDDDDDDMENGVDGLVDVFDAVLDNVIFLLEYTGKISKAKVPGHGSLACKKLTTCIKMLVGNKVLNKWKKNRTEL